MADRQGKGDNWQDIASANSIENPRLLQPGQLLDLNASAVFRVDRLRPQCPSQWEDRRKPESLCKPAPACELETSFDRRGMIWQS